MTMGYHKVDVKKLYCQSLQTPIGKLQVAASKTGICRIDFTRTQRKDSKDWFEIHFANHPQEGSNSVLKKALIQLREYFEGERRSFQVPLDLRGTAFQLRVWRELAKIPYGFTASYGEIARQVHNARAGQAVGRAVGANPVPIIVPCHRTIGHDGALVGFGGGLPTKEQLLELEGARIPFHRNQ